MLRAIAALPFVGVALVLAVTAQAEGDRVRVAPAVGVAGHYGTWTVTWTAGAGGLRTGGALTRDAIFDALYERRTYATTGARILLDFRVNGAPMGSEAVARDAPRLELTAHGRAPIERIEILRHSAADGFRAIHDLRPDALDFAWAGIDSGFRDEAIYYVRLQERGQVRGRVVMAWSSPVWVRQES